MTGKEAIKAIRFAKKVFVNTRLTDDDMILVSGIKADLIKCIRLSMESGVKKFNVLVVDKIVLVG